MHYHSQYLFNNKNNKLQILGESHHLKYLKVDWKKKSSNVHDCQSNDKTLAKGAAKKY